MVVCIYWCCGRCYCCLLVVFLCLLVCIFGVCVWIGVYVGFFRCE